MAAFYFFIDPNDIDHQIEKFGPKDVVTYSTTSSFALKPGKIKIYAPVMSNIFIFDQIDENGQVVQNKVNIILQPIVSEKSGLIPGVKYFIYRGVQKDSILKPNGKVIEENVATANQWTLALKIIKNFSNSADLIKFAYTPYDVQLESTPLTNILYPYPKVPDRPIILVNQGDCLGCCESDFGIDIVMNEYKVLYNSTIVGSLAFASKHYLSVEKKFGLTRYNPSQDNINPGREDSLVLCFRESIHNFIDPAAYLNLYYDIGIEVKNLGKVDKLDIYKKISNLFLTKNNIYIDIRNNYDHSLNFYQDCEINNESNLQFNITGLGGSDITYYTNYWPILILDNLSLPGNIIKFSMKFPCRNNSSPSIYLDFCNTIFDRNSLQIKRAQGNSKFRHFGKRVAGDYVETPSLYLYINPIESKPIAWLVRLYFLRNTKPDILNLPRITFQGSPFDNIFGCLNYGAGFFPSTLLSDQKMYSRKGIRKMYIPEGNGNPKPCMVQTGVKFDKNYVFFEAFELPGNENITELKNPPKINNIQGINASIPDTDKSLSNIKIQKITTNENILSYSQQEGELVFRLVLSEKEYLYIKELVDTEFANGQKHDFINFGFDINSTEKSDDLYYGKARLNLFGIDANGKFKQINNIGQNSTNLFVTSIDNKTFSSIECANTINSNEFEIKKRDYGKNAVYTASDYVKFIEEAERVFPKKSGQTDKNYICEILSRIRSHYYGANSKVHGYFERQALSNAIPDSPSIGANGLFDYKVSYTQHSAATPYIPENIKPLLSLADENSIEDNPSPYLRDPSNVLVDIGHVLYGLDALINNFKNTDSSFNNFQIYRSMDFAGYIADVFTAAADSRVYKNKSNGSEPSNFGDIFYYPLTNDLDRLYEISAPEPDIISDVDQFGLYNTFMYFVDLNSPLPTGYVDLTLSTLIAIYYDNTLDINQFKLDNIPVNYRKRWLNFCKKYDCTVVTPHVGTPDQKITQYQGFINPSTLQWEADDINHISVENLRTRGEIFAHFWYQKTVNKLAAGLKLKFNINWFGSNNPLAGHPYIELERSTINNIVRFEREFSNNPSIGTIDKPSYHSITGELHNHLGSYSDPYEVEYVMTKFLKYVKQKFELENP